jgi:hypothetical protein
MIIRNEDCDVEDLTPDDFADDDDGTPPEHIIYIMQQASLCKICTQIPPVPDMNESLMLFSG